MQSNLMLALYVHDKQFILCVCWLDKVNSGDAEPSLHAAFLPCPWSQAFHQWRPEVAAENALATSWSVQHLQCEHND